MRCRGGLRALAVFVLLVGMGAARRAEAAVTATPDPIAIGNVIVGSTGMGSTTLSGAATDVITIFDLSACTAEFAVTTMTPVDASMNPTVNVTYTPSAGGSDLCTVTMKNAGGTLGTFQITGTGVTPQILVTPASPVSFGSVPVAGATSSQIIHIQNTGTSDLHVMTLAFTGANAGDFALSSPPTLPATVVPNATLDVTVVFNPSATGTRTANLAIGSDDPTAGTFNEGLTGTGTAPAASISPTSIAFGSLRWSTGATTSQIVTITNNGTANLTVSALAFSGTNAADFSLSSPPALPFAIAPGAHQNLTVVFDPSAAGARTATLTITDDDPTTPMTPVSLSGTGTSAVIGVTNVAFGIVNDGTTGTGSISVTNNAATDAGPLSVTGATLAQSSTWFGFAAGNGCTAGSTSCTFTSQTAPLSVGVTCTPPALSSGTQTATVTFASNTDPGGTNVATLSCTAGRPNIMVDVTALAFGNQLVNTTSTAKTVTVTNTGSTNLTFYLTKGGTDAAMFAATATGGCGGSAGSPCTVASGASLAVSVTFTPTSPGARSAVLHINNNDPDAGDNPTDIALSGTCVAPDAGANPTSMSFGNVAVGSMSTSQTLTITNTGTATLTISNAGLVSSPSFTVMTGTVGAQTTNLAPNATAQWTIACTPQTFGALTGTFRVTSNAFTSPTINVPLDCTGQQGVLTVTPSAFDFGGVRQGDVVTHNFTLQNTGNVPVTNITATLSATTVGYSITAPTFPIASLAAGASTTVTVQFAPQSGTDGGPITITFSGTWLTTHTATTTLSITGDGLAAGYDVTPPALDFGSLRFDTTKTMTFSIVDTDTSVVRITGIGIVLGTALSGEFTVTGCTHNGTPVTCPTMASPYALSGVNDAIVVSVKCAPANRVAMMSATAHVTSDLAMNSTRDVTLTANSTTAMLGVDPAGMLLDFGAVDLDAGPVTKTITLQNTGAASLDLGAGSFGGTGLARYSFTSTSARTIAPGATFSVDVTYTPTTERPAGQFDVATLTFPLAGIQGGPSSLTMTIHGRGIDRHILCDAPPPVPDTFRNPGDKAPISTITCHNTGEATLSLSPLMITNTPIWTVVNPDPVDIPGFSDYQIKVKFSPVTSGKAPDGMLQVMNNDNGMPMVTITLSGNGIDRNVAMGPAVIDLGYTGIGIPVRLSEVAPSELLHVANMDGTNTFNIQSITLDGDGSFTIEDSSGKTPAMVPLAPSTTAQFDVVFTPTAEGEFQATATLFLDQDPTAQATVQLRGHAVFVDAHGGGGCSVGAHGGGGNGPGGLVLVGAALLVGRRRRRGALVAAAGGVLALFATPAIADPTRNLDLTVFDPVPATNSDGIAVQSATVGASGDFVATAVASYASNPLVLGTVQNEDAAVKSRTMLLVGGAYAFGDRFEAGLHMPLYFQSGDALDSSMMFGVPPASGTARGDLTLHAKAQLVKTPAGFAFGLGGALTVPTASDGQFAGSDKVAGRVLALGALAIGDKLTVLANAGGVLRSKAQFANVVQQSGVAYGVGIAYRPLYELDVTAEVFGDLVPSGRLDAMGHASTMTTMEALLGARYQLDKHINAGIGVGRGLTSGIGSPDLRGLVMVTVAPTGSVHERAKPVHIEGDRDGDGIGDDEDKCPNEPEDKDGFDDSDGCPDPDNDNDGVADAQDKCPIEAEDRDGFQDDDGCPDPDNDGDGIPDKMDRCPNDPEDKDGFQDVDGCPDPDNDGDGIPDAQDKCPNEPETINGNADDDGCPDKGDSLIAISPDRLELLEAVGFTGAKIDRKSFNVLGQLGATLRAHPEILRLRVTVHVQPSSNGDKDQALSDARAKAVRDWLVQWGIPEKRLEARGFGGTKPLVPANSRGAAQINDRVEFVILERK